MREGVHPAKVQQAGVRQTLQAIAERGWRGGLEQALGLDLRALAVCRIAVGLTVAADGCMRLGDWEAHYGRHGVLPPAQWMALYSEVPGNHCLLMASSSDWLPWLALLGLILAGLSLALGWRVRLSSLVGFVLLVTLQHRNPLILTGADQELRVLLWMGWFLPWDRRYAWKRPRENETANWVWDPGTMVFKGQLLLLYWSASLAKRGTGWSEGTGVLISLSAPQYQTPAGAALLHLLQTHPFLVEWCDAAVALGEGLLPLGLLVPWSRVQSLAALGLMAMHLGFGICLDLDLFSVVCISALVAFVPFPETTLAPAVWRRRASLAGLWMLSLGFCCTLDSSRRTTFLVPAASRTLALAAGLDQRWIMFAPPPTEGGWHQLVGTTQDGRKVDLWSAATFDDHRPAWVHASYPNVRWYLFVLKMLRAPDEHPGVRQACADYLRRSWERAHPDWEDRLRKVELIFQRERWNGERFGAAQRLLLWTADYP